VSDERVCKHCGLAKWIHFTQELYCNAFGGNDSPKFEPTEPSSATPPADREHLSDPKYNPITAAPLPAGQTGVQEIEYAKAWLKDALSNLRFQHTVSAGVCIEQAQICLQNLRDIQLSRKLADAASLFGARVRERNPDWFREEAGSTDFAEARDALKELIEQVRGNQPPKGALCEIGNAANAVNVSSEKEKSCSALNASRTDHSGAEPSSPQAGPVCPKCGSKSFSVSMMGRGNQIATCSQCDCNAPVDQFLPAASRLSEQSQEGPRTLYWEDSPNRNKATDHRHVANAQANHKCGICGLLHRTEESKPRFHLGQIVHWQGQVGDCEGIIIEITHPENSDYVLKLDIGDGVQMFQLESGVEEVRHVPIATLRECMEAEEHPADRESLQRCLFQMQEAAKDLASRLSEVEREWGSQYLKTQKARTDLAEANCKLETAEAEVTRLEGELAEIRKLLNLIPIAPYRLVEIKLQNLLADSSSLATAREAINKLVELISDADGMLDDSDYYKAWRDKYDVVKTVEESAALASPTSVAEGGRQRTAPGPGEAGADADADGVEP
jgi:hypothetical protein